MILPDALKQTLLYGASIALMKGVSLLMLPFIANHLAPEAFGRLEVISSLAVIGSIVVGMGLEDTLFRFVGSTNDPHRRRNLAADIFGLALLIGAAAGLAGWLAAPRIAGWVPGHPTIYEVRLVLSVLALEGMIAIPLGWLRMRNLAVLFFLLTTGRALTQAVLVVVLLSADRGVKGILEAGLIAAVLQAVVLVFLQVRDTGIRCSRETGYRSLIYSLPIVGSGLVAFVLNGLDRWILAHHAVLADVARFGVASKFALAVVLLLQPFGMWWSPRRFEVLNGLEGHRKVARYIALGIALTLILTVLVGLVSPLLITGLLPETYAEASQYAVGLVLVMACKEMAELVNIGCFIGRTTGAQLAINTIGAAAGILGMIWWAPVYSVWGVILALLAAQTIRLVLFFSVSQHLLRLPYPSRSLLMLLAISLAWLTLGSLAVSVGQQLLVLLGAMFCLPIAALQLGLIPVPVFVMPKVFSQ